MKPINVILYVAFLILCAYASGWTLPVLGRNRCTYYHQVSLWTPIPSPSCVVWTSAGVVRVELPPEW